MNTKTPEAYRIGFLGPLQISPNLEGLLVNLGKMLRDHFDLYLALGDGCESRWLQEYYRIYPYTARMIDRAEIFTSLSACRQFAKAVRPDLLVNVINPASAGFAVVSVGNRHKIANIVRMSGHSFEEAAAHKRPWKRLRSWLLHDRMAGRAYHRADHIITVGERLKEALVDRGIKPGRVTVLPQPVDINKFSSLSGNKKVERKASLGLDPQRKTILFVGRLSWLKGADRLLEVVTAVSRQSRSFQFCLIGQGEYRNRFMGFSSKLVLVPGYVPHQQVAAYFQAADLLVLPSRTEGLPNAILEALSCRVPVMAAPVGDIPNWVSRLGTESADYVDYILKEKWVVDKLPDFMQFDRLQAAYIEFFKRVIAGKR